MTKKINITVFALVFQLIHLSYLSQTYLTNAQVYDFGVGDVIQGKHEASGSFFFGLPTYETNTIIGKVFSQASDSIYYTIK
jgi:hypothetical protein